MREAVADKPGTSYIVSVFGKPHRRTVLTPKNKAEADAMEQAMAQDGVKAQIEEITPRKR
jgi:hypothetical protein